MEMICWEDLALSLIIVQNYIYNIFIELYNKVRKNH